MRMTSAAPVLTEPATSPNSRIQAGRIQAGERRAGPGRPAGRTATILLLPVAGARRADPAGQPEDSRRPVPGRARASAARIPATQFSAGRRPAARPQAAPLRLTRRGRVLLGLLVTALATVLITLLAAGPASGVPASGHRPGPGGYRGMTQIVVRPGQSLWSIASAAEPAADPRVVIQQILSANALRGYSIQAGQLLWVPKG
ncbi:MAG: LysM peptidoglycan-binding domain-containing protein [Streptosporangiaceae bacterium]